VSYQERAPFKILYILDPKDIRRVGGNKITKCLAAKRASPFQHRSVINVDLFTRKRSVKRILKVINVKVKFALTDTPKNVNGWKQVVVAEEILIVTIFMLVMEVKNMKVLNVKVVKVFGKTSTVW
jgi:hypothetical protein